MKTKLLITLFLPFMLMAQDYQPVLTDGAFWDVGYYDHESLCSIDPARRYVLGDEVTVDGQTYRQVKVYIINGVESGPCYVAPFLVENEFTIAEELIRENITEKKVYIRIFEGNSYQEKLLYDFNLEVGETMENTYGQVMELISITVENGVKTFNFDGYSYTEGVGGIGGIIYPLEPQFEYYDDLVCYGNLITNENECSRFLATDDFILKNVNMHPNPVKDNLIIESDLPLKISIFSILGKEIKTFNTINNATINTSNLNQGVYFVKVFSQDNNAEKTFKIVKN